MPSSTNDQCEHCHSEYSLIKRKKICAVCCQSYCTNCAPREQYQNHSYRICVICQLISNQSTTDNQLLELKVKHLRCYLQAKDIPHNTCTEKQELVDLIKQNRQRPFTRLFNQQSTTAPSSSSSAKPGPLTNLQQTVSSFANQVNNFASNVQDYVTTTVSDVTSSVSGALNTTLGEQPSNNPAPPVRNTTTSAPVDPPQRRPAPAAAASSTSTANPRAHRKSLSEITTEANIEDLNIRELKEILAANFVDFQRLCRKSELMEESDDFIVIDKLLKAKGLSESTASDTELCKICMDAMADCVFLDCGHMLTCVKCGKLLAECPICRSNIVRVVRVFKS